MMYPGSLFSTEKLSVDVVKHKWAPKNPFMCGCVCQLIQVQEPVRKHRELQTQLICMEKCSVLSVCTVGGVGFIGLSKVILNGI